VVVRARAMLRNSMKSRRVKSQMIRLHRFKIVVGLMSKKKRNRIIRWLKILINPQLRNLKREWMSNLLKIKNILMSSH
jgi:hypothetical protein